MERAKVAYPPAQAILELPTVASEPGLGGSRRTGQRWRQPWSESVDGEAFLEALLLVALSARVRRRFPADRCWRSACRSNFDGTVISTHGGSRSARIANAPTTGRRERWASGAATSVVFRDLIRAKYLTKLSEKTARAFWCCRRSVAGLPHGQRR